jgi:hypothetical protein
MSWLPWVDPVTHQYSFKKKLFTLTWIVVGCAIIEQQLKQEKKKKGYDNNAAAI